MDWDDGMILNVALDGSSSEELEEEEDNGAQEETLAASENERALRKRKESESSDPNNNGDVAATKAEDDEEGQVKKKRGPKGGHKSVPVTEDKDDDINYAIKLLMAADSSYVGDEWQSGAKKMNSKAESSAKLLKESDVPVTEDSQPDRKGLEDWQFAAMEDEDKGFEDLGIDATIVAHLIETDFGVPKKVQRCMVPAFLSGRDLLVGSGPKMGKSFGYILPLVHQLQSQKPRISRGEGTFAIVLCASKESCCAVSDALKQLMRKFCWWLTSSHFVGGENRSHEKARLRKGVTVVVATDTRLLDHLENTAAFQTQDLRWFIVDEAAEHLQSKRGNRIRRAVRMLEDRVRDSSGVERRQQNILITSSMDPELGSLAVWMLKRPMCVGLKPRLGKRFWDVLPVDSWEIKPFVPDSDIQSHDVYGQRYKKQVQKD